MDFFYIILSSLQESRADSVFIPLSIFILPNFVCPFIRLMPSGSLLYHQF